MGPRHAQRAKRNVTLLAANKHSSVLPQTRQRPREWIASAKPAINQHWAAGANEI
jgi:hypothetical protein